MLQSYGVENYTVHACYDFLPPTTVSSQPLLQFATYKSTTTNSSAITITSNTTSLSFPLVSSPYTLQAGALLSFDTSNTSTTNSVLARFGVSFISTDQACSNAEEEISDWDWDEVQSASREQWEDVLERVVVDTNKENATVVELLYSSVSLESSVILCRKGW